MTTHEKVLQYTKIILGAIALGYVIWRFEGVANDIHTLVCIFKNGCLIY